MLAAIVANMTGAVNGFFASLQIPTSPPKFEDDETEKLVKLATPSRHVEPFDFFFALTVRGVLPVAGDAEIGNRLSASGVLTDIQFLRISDREPVRVAVDAGDDLPF